MKRFGYEITLDAQRDLAGIYNYYADLGEAQIGRRIVESISTKIRVLAAQRNSGVARNWLSPGLRAFPYKNRCIYFRIVGNNLVVVHIAHSRQDVRPEMFEAEDDT